MFMDILMMQFSSYKEKIKPCHLKDIEVNVKVVQLAAHHTLQMSYTSRNQCFITVQVIMYQ